MGWWGGVVGFWLGDELDGVQYVQQQYVIILTRYQIIYLYVWQGWFAWGVIPHVTMGLTANANSV